jgi:hypothetical protein
MINTHESNELKIIKFTIKRRFKMKRFLLVAAMASTTFVAPAFATDVGVSVSIGHPGFYGQLDIGGHPQPRVLYRQPRIIERSYEEREPIYLRVPPGHARNWSRHCHEYNACGERVYFVQDSWYNNEYAPRYREQHRDRGDDRHDDQRHDRRDGDRGNNGQGNNRDRGNNRQGNDHDRDHN